MKDIKLKNIFVILLSAVVLITGTLYSVNSHKASLSFAASDAENDLDNIIGGGMPPIRIATWYTEDNLIYLKAFLAKQFPDYVFEFEYIDKSNYEPIIDSQLSYKGAPDILYMDMEMVQKHAKSGYIVPLTDICKNFGKEMWDAFGYGNEVYAIPNTSQFECIYYNKTLFKEKGVRVPSTFQNFVGTCDNLRIVKRIKPMAISLKNPYALSDSALAVVSANYFSTDRGSGFGGRLKYGRTTFREEFLPYMDDWEELIEHKIFTKEMFSMDSLTAIEQFVAGDAAMIVGGPETYNAIVRLDPKMDIGTMPFYTRGGCKEAVVGGCDIGFALNKNSKNVEQAKKVIETLATFGGQLALWRDRPGSQTYLRDTNFVNSDVYDGISECIERGHIYAPWMEWGDTLNNPVRKHLGLQLQQRLLGEMTTEEVIDDVDKIVNKLLGKN